MSFKPIFLVLPAVAIALAATATPPRIPDARKAVVEAPIKKKLKAPGPVNAAPPGLDEKVAPGDVSWHPDMATAQRASQKSKKPVLLFQLLGDLDQRFS